MIPAVSGCPTRVTSCHTVSAVGGNHGYASSKLRHVQREVFTAMLGGPFPDTRASTSPSRAESGVASCFLGDVHGPSSSGRTP